MNMKPTLTIACVLLKSAWRAVFLRSAFIALLLAPLAALQADDAPQQKPNILLLIDDLGWKDISPKARGIAVFVRCWIGHGFG